jgi:hypothetical protein
VDARYGPAPENPRRHTYIPTTAGFPLGRRAVNPARVLFWCCKKITWVAILKALEDVRAECSVIQTSRGYFNDLSMGVPGHNIGRIF